MSKEGKKQEEQKPQQKMREVIIQTDGNSINLTKNETAGNLELIALLSTVLNKLQQTQR